MASAETQWVDIDGMRLAAQAPTPSNHCTDAEQSEAMVMNRTNTPCQAIANRRWAGQHLSRIYALWDYLPVQRSSYIVRFEASVGLRAVPRR